jgi:hypothetical protein
MATAYNNLVKHLELATRQLKEIKTKQTVLPRDAEENLYDLVDIINDLVLAVCKESH